LPSSYFLYFRNSSSVRSNALTILSSCVVGTSLSILLQTATEPEQTTNRRKSKKVSAVTSSFLVVLVDTHNLSETSWENIQSEDLEHFSIPLGTEEGNYLLCSHQRTNAISVIFPESSSSYKWLKISQRAETLLSLEIPTSSVTNVPTFCVGTENTLCLISSQSLTIWNIHYGVPFPQKGSSHFFSSFTSSFPPSFIPVSGHSVSLFYGTIEDSEDTKTLSLQRHLFNISDSSALQLLHSDLSTVSNAATPQLSLGSMIGSLKKRPLESDFQPATGTRTRRKSSATEDGILNRLDESKRKILLKISVEEKDEQRDPSLDAAVVSFLRCCESISSLTPKVETVLQIWTDVDWKVFESMIKLKMIGLSAYPAVFNFLLDATKASFDLRSVGLSPSSLPHLTLFRFPLLVSFAKYSIDLSEVQAMKLISLVAYFSHTSSSGDSPNDPPNDGKKRRKSHAKTSVSDSQPSSEIPSPAISLERLTLLMDALLYRKHGFNSSVLSEATASLLSLPLVGILIRILSNMLHGVCNSQEPWRLPISPASTPPFPTSTPYLEYNDKALGNIVTWLESLLESHHTSILFAIKSSSSDSSSDSLVESLLCLLKVMKELPSAMNLAESTFGISMHYQRLMKYQSRSLSTSQAMKEKRSIQHNADTIGNDNYQLEVVRFF
jgi:hypothetical protein